VAYRRPEGNNPLLSRDIQTSPGAATTIAANKKNVAMKKLRDGDRRESSECAGGGDSYGFTGVKEEWGNESIGVLIINIL